MALSISLLISLADMLMSAIPAIAFRLAKTDIALDKANDWGVFIIFGAIIPSILSSFSSVVILFSTNRILIGQFWAAVLFWSTGSLIAICLITPIFLLMFSKIIERAGLIVKTLLI